MFSGQGSQYYGMARELYEKNSMFKEYFIKQNNIVREIAGISVIDELYNQNKNLTQTFDRMLFTHPAIFMVEYALAQVLIENDIIPDLVLGVSMGEFASAAISGIMSLEDSLEAVIMQAQIVESYCPKGSMIAIMDNINTYKSTPIFSKFTELAAVNYNQHFVISVGDEDIQKVLNYLQKKSIMFQQLPVRFPYHSSKIDPASSYYLSYLRGKSYKIPKIDLVSCATGSIERKFSSDYLWNVVRKPIIFSQAIQLLENKNDYIYIDLGPSGTLSNFTKNNLKLNSESKCFSILTQFRQDIKNLKVINEYFRDKKLTEEREKKSMLTYMFPGQGSQQIGMGKELFEEFPEIISKTDKILGYSIKQLCLEDRDQLLGKTMYTQPALYVVGVLSYLKKVNDTGEKPDFVAGHSLGEYVALFVAGVYDFETGLRIVKKRAELMNSASGGKMAAVIGMSEQEVESLLEKNNLFGIDIANINSPSQVVLSGRAKDIERAQIIFENVGGKKYIVLNVSGAFHSRYMKEAADSFRNFLQQFSFKEMSIPVISNKTARPYKSYEIIDTMVAQITSSVKWTESIRYLMGCGVNRFEQIGPGNILMDLFLKIQQESEPLYVEEKKKKNAILNNPNIEKHCSDIRNETLNIELYKQDKFQSRMLGNAEFKKDYNLEYAYLAGSMYNGISSKEMVVKMGKAGMLAFLGTGGMEFERIEKEIEYIKGQLKEGQPYGLNLMCSLTDAEKEERTVDLFIKHSIKIIEASSYMSITPALVRYRLYGIKKGEGGKIETFGKIIAKVSRIEVAEGFLNPAPQRIVDKLLENGAITEEESKLAKFIPMADDICIEADSAGYTDRGMSHVLIPTMIRLRDMVVKKHGYLKNVRVGTAGGIGTPESAAAVFLMGADFIMTGSINQCTVEADTSDEVKDILQQMSIHDTEYTSSGNLFELGAKVQVLKRGLFFPARANKLYDLYRQHNSIDEIDEKIKMHIQQRYFGRTFDEVYEYIRCHCSDREIEKAEKDPKHKMALIFRWYFDNSMKLALKGCSEKRLDYQIYCGPALGAFNDWVRNSDIENWRKRHVDAIGKMLMKETVELLQNRMEKFRIFREDKHVN